MEPYAKVGHGKLLISLARVAPSTGTILLRTRAQKLGIGTPTTSLASTAVAIPRDLGSDFAPMRPQARLNIRRERFGRCY
jgi:hypothetical protein